MKVESELGSVQTAQHVLLEGRLHGFASMLNLLGEVRQALARDFHGFAPVARLRSEDTESRPNSGELPALTREELAIRAGDAVAEAAFALARPGNLHDGVIESTAGHHIIRLVERQPAASGSLEDVRATLERSRVVPRMQPR